MTATGKHISLTDWRGFVTVMLLLIVFNQMMVMREIRANHAEQTANLEYLIEGQWTAEDYDRAGYRLLELP